MGGSELSVRYAPSTGCRRKVLDPLQSLVTDAESVHRVLYADLRIRDLQARLQQTLMKAV